MSVNLKRPDRDLNEILSDSKRKWQELIDNLVPETPQSLISPAPTDDHSANWRKDLATPISQAAFRPYSCKSGPERLTSQVILRSRDDDTILQRNEQLRRITRVMERLTKVEKQNHKIMVLIFALTITAFLFLLVDTNLFPKSESLQLTQIPGPSMASDVKAGVGPDNPVSGGAAASYVGVKTSNEYHLSDCEAAQTGASEVLTAFTSAAEAKRRGFKPCRLCQPPKTD